jgi:formate hydrogenlyase transcriptional activator
MTAHDYPAQFWPYGDVASQPDPTAIEDRLLRALRQLTSTLDVASVCHAVLTGVENAFDVSSSWVMFHEPAANTLRTVEVRGSGAQAYADVEIPVTRGLVGHVFTHGEIRFVPDVTLEQHWFDSARVHASGLKAVVLVPLMSGDRPIGVLGLASPQFGAHRAPTPLELKRLEIFAAQAAIALQHAQRYESSQQDRARLRSLLRERRALRHEVLTLRGDLRYAGAFGPIIGESDAMKRVLVELEQVASSDVTVLLLGETGTGKELLARALHERSQRSTRAFIPVNCAALPEQLVESEMFGHERGSFTGAHVRKPGRFELAHRGTLCLDEVGDLPLAAQAKLLRVLQDGDVYRVGSTAAVRVDVRLVAATNRDLSAAVAKGMFREDLFYRLSVFPIKVPALRERPEDIPDLARHFAAESARRLGKPIREIDQAAVDHLVAYAWPGNIRELRNVIERACIVTMGEVVTIDAVRLEPVQLPPRPAEMTQTTDSATTSSVATRISDEPASKPTLADAERHAIVRALRDAEGRISGPGGAAARLGLKPTTLHAKMKKLGVRRRDMLAS